MEGDPIVAKAYELGSMGSESRRCSTAAVQEACESRELMLVTVKRRILGIAFFFLLLGGGS